MLVSTEIFFTFFSQKTELGFDNSHAWFKKFIDHWFQVAKKKALARIAKAVEIDQVGTFG